MTGLREAIARTLFESDRQAIDGGAAPWDDEMYGDGLLGLRTAYRQNADAVLALAALRDVLAAAARDAEAVERVREIAEECVASYPQGQIQLKTIGRELFRALDPS